MEIKEYKIIWGETKPELVQSVNEHLKEGFEPLGGVRISEISINPRSGMVKHDFHQTMIKRRKSEIL